MRVFRHGCIATLAFVICLSAAAGPEDFLLKVHGRGKAQGIGLHAREQAMAQARDNALKALAGSIVGDTNPQLAEDLVLECVPFVRSANVVDHRVDQSATLVNAEFLVNIVQVRQAAVRLLLPQLPYKPRVLVLIADDLHDEIAVSGTRIAAQALEQAIRDAGLDVADSQPVRDALPAETVRAILSEDQGGVNLLGYDPEVDVAVLGIVSAAFVPTDKDTNLRATRAHLVLRVIRADDGKLVDSAAIDAVVHSVDFMEGATQAIQDAVGKLAQYAINAAALAVVGPEASYGFALTLEAPGTHENVDLLRTRLAELGAQDIQEVFYADQAARLHFSYPGELHDVIKPLVERDYPAFRLENRQTFGRRSVIRFHPLES